MSKEEILEQMKNLRQIREEFRQAEIELDSKEWSFDEQRVNDAEYTLLNGLKRIGRDIAELLDRLETKVAKID